MCKQFLLLATFLVSLVLQGAAQDGTGWYGCAKNTDLIVTCNGECGPSSPDPRSLHGLAGDILRTEYPLRLTPAELRSALRSDDARLRFLAAWELADQDQKDAIPDIFAAFDSESQPRPKAYLACALTELGDPRGPAALHKFCENDGLPEDLRLDVVRFLIEIHETPCITAVVDALKGPDPFNWQVISIIPNIKGLFSWESDQLQALLLTSLSHPGSGVRMEAARALAQMHDTSAIPALQVALANETNAIARKALQDAINSLQAEQH